MNASLAEYHVPVNRDIPHSEIIFNDIPDPHTPLGTHGVGELGITGGAAAIANAVFHATGTRVRELPITLDKLLNGARMWKESPSARSGDVVNHIADHLYGCCSMMRCLFRRSSRGAHAQRVLAGETNPASQRVDFSIFGPQMNAQNRPTTRALLHFFGMDIIRK